MNIVDCSGVRSRGMDNIEHELESMVESEAQAIALARFRATAVGVIVVVLLAIWAFRP